MRLLSRTFIFTLPLLSWCSPFTELPLPAVEQSRSVVFVENCEGDRPFETAHQLETGDWSYALQLVAKPAYEGRQSARFEIHADQPLVKHGKRSEAVIIKNIPTREMWYSFAVYFPSNGFEKDTEREVISQWYQNGTPATSLRVKNDSLFLESGPTPENRRPYHIAALDKDKWHTIVLHFIHAHDGSGRVNVWYDGKSVLDVKGGNMYADVLPKWKIGLYKAAFKRGTSKVAVRVIYFDNIKVGNASATYAQMRP